MLSAVGVTIAVCLGMWSSEVGSGMPMTLAFSWHPVLMTLGYVTLMTLGRWAYLAEPSELLGTVDLQGRRNLHRACMALASAAVLAGYVAIFMAHWPSGKFFGYNFVEGTWSEWRCVLHVHVGYSLVVLAAAQVVMGFLKLNTLRTGGPRIFPFHGLVGKGVIILGTAEVLLATWFWAWAPQMKAAVSALAVTSCILGAFAPRSPGESPADQDGDEAELLSDSQ